MGTYLHLVLPDNKLNDYSIIDEYEKFREDKSIRYREKGFIKMAISKIKSNTQARVKLVKESSKNFGKVFIWEQPVSLRDTDAFAKAYKVLFYNHKRPETDYKNILYGKKIEQLIKYLREGKEELKKLAKDEDEKNSVEVHYELNIIALCEFSLKKRFGLRLSE